MSISKPLNKLPVEKPSSNDIWGYMWHFFWGINRKKCKTFLRFVILQYVWDLDIDMHLILSTTYVFVQYNTACSMSCWQKFSHMTPDITYVTKCLGKLVWYFLDRAVLGNVGKGNFQVLTHLCLFWQVNFDWTMFYLLANQISCNKNWKWNHVYFFEM